MSSTPQAQADQLHALGEHHHQQHHHAGMHQPAANGEVEPALRHARLADAEEIRVHDEGEQREQQVRGAAGARIDEAHGNGEQRQHQRRNRDADAPHQLPEVDVGRIGDQRPARQALRRGRRLRALLGLDARRVTVELGDAVVGVARHALVAPALLEHQEAVSVCPERLMLTPVRFWYTEATNTFCTVFEPSETDSTKYTRSLLEVSPNTPGLIRVTSSRDSRRLPYCPAICAAHGDMNSDSAAISTICGSANSITGLSQAVSESPEPSQITISESRQPRVSVSSTEMNMVSDSSTGSAPSAKKPRNAITASDGTWPPAALPRRRISCVVSAIANSVMNTAPARPVNSLSSARWKIMRYFRYGI